MIRAHAQNYHVKEEALRPPHISQRRKVGCRDASSYAHGDIRASRRWAPRPDRCAAPASTRPGLSDRNVQTPWGAGSPPPPRELAARPPCSCGPAVARVHTSGGPAIGTSLPDGVANVDQRPAATDGPAAAFLEGPPQGEPGGRSAKGSMRPEKKQMQIYISKL